MRIYIDREPYTDYADFILKDVDCYLLRLFGINVYLDRNRRLRTEPVYLPLLRVWRSPGILHIELPHLLILLMRRKPWIYLERTNQIELED